VPSSSVLSYANLASVCVASIIRMTTAYDARNPDKEGKSPQIHLHMVNLTPTKYNFLQQCCGAPFNSGLPLYVAVYPHLAHSFAV
jgi:hypothetical protein